MTQDVIPQVCLQPCIIHVFVISCFTSSQIIPSSVSLYTYILINHSCFKPLKVKGKNTTVLFPKLPFFFQPMRDGGHLSGHLLQSIRVSTIKRSGTQALTQTDYVLTSCVSLKKESPGEVSLTSLYPSSCISKTRGNNYTYSTKLIGKTECTASYGKESLLSFRGALEKWLI
jgi:hypothetical protein